MALKITQDSEASPGQKNTLWFSDQQVEALTEALTEEFPQEEEETNTAYRQRLIDKVFDFMFNSVEEKLKAIATRVGANNRRQSIIEEQTAIANAAYARAEAIRIKWRQKTDLPTEPDPV
jgi:acyl-CoA reductase-like NAD-dependent aldehyde dehydrogenase